MRGAVAMEREGNLWIDEHDTLEGRHDVVQLCGVGFKELTACGHVEEKVFDLEIAADRTGHRLLTYDARAGDG